MTKILFIPEGEYLYFITSRNFKGSLNNFEETFEYEKSIWAAGAFPMSLIEFLDRFLIGDLIKHQHAFIKTITNLEKPIIREELEIIYD